MAMIKENRDLKRRYKKSEKRMNKPDCLIFVAK